MPHATVRTLLAALVLVMGGCANTTLRSPIVVEWLSTEAKLGTAGLTPNALQSEVQSFADSFNSAASQIWTAIAINARNAMAAEGLTEDQIARENRIRRAALEIKLANVNASLMIASSPNPLVALADMITLVSLQRMVLESPSTEKLVGEEIQGQLVVVYKEQEYNAWKIADLAMTQEQRNELREMIRAWRDNHPDATYVSGVRMDDFASMRQIGVTPTEAEAPSLLASLSLDPLAGLSPAQREVTKTRMLAERIFFYASRMPTVIKWQVESLYQSLVQAPEFKDILGSAHRASVAAEQLSKLAADLPGQITQERASLLRHFFDELTKERTATVEQINAALSSQRRAALDDLRGAQGEFQGTLKEFRETAGTANTLAEKLTETIKAADVLAAKFAPAMPPAPASNPSAGNAPGEGETMREFRSTAERTADAAERLTQLARSIEQLLGSPNLRENGPIRSVVREVQFSSKEVVDYAFWRLLIVVLAAPFATALAMLGYRWAVKR